MSLYPACHEIISGCVIYKVLSKDLPRLTLYKIKWKNIVLWLRLLAHILMGCRLCQTTKTFHSALFTNVVLHI